VSLAVLDWRRRVAALYAEVRATDDPATAHTLWRHGRDRLFLDHPASPLPAADRDAFTGLRYSAYDPSLRFTLDVDTAGPGADLEVPTGTTAS
jgi:hypothetical protein